MKYGSVNFRVDEMVRTFIFFCKMPVDVYDFYRKRCFKRRKACLSTWFISEFPKKKYEYYGAGRSGAIFYAFL